VKYYSKDYPAIKVQGPSKMYVFESGHLEIPDDDAEGIDCIDAFMRTSMGNGVRKLDAEEAEKAFIAANKGKPKPLAQQVAGNSMAELQAHMKVAKEYDENLTEI